MTRTRPDETTEGSAEELRLDAAQYAAEAATHADTTLQAMRELAEAITARVIDPPSTDGSLTNVLASAVLANTSATLGLSARLGQLAAVLAERPGDGIA